ncbi:MAG: PEP-CTERM sorting domain-containing protein [Chthoniobacteraceae bacterium]
MIAHITRPLLAALFTFSTGLVATSGAAEFSFDFNTIGDTEGWDASMAPANAVVTGFTATTDIDGTAGVLTSSDIDIDPQIIRGAANAILLPAGETWSSMVIRFRQLSGNPQDVGTTSAPYAESGTILFFNSSLDNFGIGPVTNVTNFGTGAYSGDLYFMTLTPEASGDWQVMNLDFSDAPILGSEDFTSIRFDPVGNDAARNFEIDYIRVTSIPEPGSAIFTLVGLAGLALRRRK